VSRRSPLIETLLEEKMSDAYADACGIDPDTPTCSQLLVDTVGDWVAER
jgi:hypothetical protein